MDHLVLSFYLPSARLKPQGAELSALRNGEFNPSSLPISTLPHDRDNDIHKLNNSTTGGMMTRVADRFAQGSFYSFPIYHFDTKY